MFILEIKVLLKLTSFLTVLVLCVLVQCTNVTRWFEKLYMTILLTLRVFVSNLLRGNRRKTFFSIFLFEENVWIGFLTRISWLCYAIPYLQDHGDFMDIFYR